MRQSSFLLALLGALFLLAGLCPAQVTARLSGPIVDPTGLAVPAATVDIFRVWLLWNDGPDNWV